MKKIAVCFAGQPRFIGNCAENIKRRFTIDGYQTDYYYHLWNNISSRYVGRMHNVIKYFDQNLINDLMQKYYPNSYGYVEDERDEYLGLIDTIYRLLAYSGKYTDRAFLTYNLSEFYSWRSSYIIPLEMAREYDVIIKMRTDLVFNEDMWVDSKFFTEIEEDTLYNTTEYLTDLMYPCMNESIIWHHGKSLKPMVDNVFHSVLMDNMNFIQDNDLRVQLYAMENMFYRAGLKVFKKVNPRFMSIFTARSNIKSTKPSDFWSLLSSNENEWGLKICNNETSKECCDFFMKEAEAALNEN